MKQYEITFIVDPVLSGDEIKATAQTYVDMLKSNGATIVYMDEMGLRQLAYPINRRTSGIYYCVEFQVETGEFISKMELALRRDERIMRFLTVALDKYGVKYNEDKRNGLIGKRKRGKDKDSGDKKDNRSSGRSGSRNSSSRSSGSRTTQRTTQPKTATAAPAAPAPATATKAPEAKPSEEEE
ncbi:MAG: 30S ribosomal protein S6 [Bacteroidota bacterium]